MKKKLRIPLIILAAAVLLFGLSVVIMSSRPIQPPDLYVNRAQAVCTVFLWQVFDCDAPGPLEIEYGPENTITASLGDTLELRNKLPWLGLRKCVQITLYDAETKTCYASWPLESRPALTKGYADPGSYIMEIYAEYQGLLWCGFDYGQAIYGAILNVEA